MKQEAHMDHNAHVPIAIVSSRKLIYPYTRTLSRKKIQIFVLI